MCVNKKLAWGGIWAVVTGSKPFSVRVAYLHSTFVALLNYHGNVSTALVVIDVFWEVQAPG